MACTREFKFGMMTHNYMYFFYSIVVKKFNICILVLNIIYEGVQEIHRNVSWFYIIISTLNSNYSMIFLLCVV